MRERTWDGEIKRGKRVAAPVSETAMYVPRVGLTGTVSERCSYPVLDSRYTEYNRAGMPEEWYTYTQRQDVPSRCALATLTGELAIRTSRG